MLSFLEGRFDHFGLIGKGVDWEGVENVEGLSAPIHDSTMNQ